MFAALCHCCLDKACMGRPTCVSRSNDSLSIAVITESTHCPCVNFFFSFFFFLSFVTRGPLAMLCSTLCSTLFEVFRLVSFFFFLSCRPLTSASVFIICRHQFSHTCPVALHFSLFTLADAPPRCIEQLVRFALSKDFVLPCWQLCAILKSMEVLCFA